MIHETVWVILHALPFGKSIELLGHHTEQVELFSSVGQVNADTIAEVRERRRTTTMISSCQLHVLQVSPK